MEPDALGTLYYMNSYFQIDNPESSRIIDGSEAQEFNIHDYTSNIIPQFLNQEVFIDRRIEMYNCSYINLLPISFSVYYNMGILHYFVAVWMISKLLVSSIIWSSWYSALYSIIDWLNWYAKFRKLPYWLRNWKHRLRVGTKKNRSRNIFIYIYQTLAINLI